MDERGTAVAAASASVTLYFRSGADGAGEAGGPESEGRGSGDAQAAERRIDTRVSAACPIAKCRELRDANMKSDSGGAPLVCTLPHVRRRQSLLLSRISVDSLFLSGWEDPRTHAPRSHHCIAREGHGTLGGFWHILTLASDWADQAREALDMFERLAAARIASSVRVLVSGPFADIVAEWIYERQRSAESSRFSGGSSSGDAGGGCGGAVWKRVHVWLWKDTRGATRLEYQSSFLRDLLTSLQRSTFDRVWVASTGLRGLPGAAGSWHMAAEGSPHMTSYDLDSAWSVLIHPDPCLAALEAQDGSRGGLRGQTGDVCASCVRVHPVVHLDCHAFWATARHLMSLIPPSKMVEKELYTLHHDLMASDWVTNAWSVRLVHDVSVHEDTAHGLDDPIVERGGQRGPGQRWQGSDVRAQQGGERQNCADSGGACEKVCWKDCKSDQDGESQGTTVEQKIKERVGGNARADVLSFWSPGYMEHTSQLAILVQTEIDFDAAAAVVSLRAQAAAEDARLQGMQQETHERGHTTVGDGADGENTRGWDMEFFVRLLVYCKDSTRAFLEVHAPLPSVVSQEMVDGGIQAGPDRGGKAAIRGRNVLDVRAFLTQLIPHMPVSHGPMVEIDVVVSLFAARGREHRNIDYADFPSTEAVLRSEIQASVSGESRQRQSGDSTRVLEDADSRHTLPAFLAHTNSRQLPDPLTPPLASARTRFVLHGRPGGSVELQPPRAPSGNSSECDTSTRPLRMCLCAGVIRHCQSPWLPSV